MSRYTLLILNGAILTGCAVFIYPARTIVITALLLLLPLLDRQWHIPDFALQKKQFPFILTLLFLYSLLISLHFEISYQALSILFLVALPEEWFFRAYFMTRVESFLSEKKISFISSTWLANISTSVFFASIHVPTQGWFGLSIFLPSLVFGWVYHKYNNLILVIILHTISNLVFILYIKSILIRL